MHFSRGQIPSNMAKGRFLNLAKSCFGMTTIRPAVITFLIVCLSFICVWKSFPLNDLSFYKLTKAKLWDNKPYLASYNHVSATCNGRKYIKPHSFYMAFEECQVPSYLYKIPHSNHQSDRYRLKSSLDVPESEVNLEPGKTSKLILFYNPPGWFSHVMPTCNKAISMCPIKTCKCSRNRDDLSKADGVIIDGVELRMSAPMTKRASQAWIFFTLECPFYFESGHYKNKNWRQMFNWTMTYRLDSDIPIPYDILLHRPASKNYTDIAMKKTKSAVWLVSNCHTPSKRHLYVKKLKKYYNVAIFGRCGNKSELGVSTLLNQYRFYLAFENSFCFDYITEKLFKTYAADINIIPVVRGGADYKKMIPNGTYLNAADFTSPKQLGQRLSYLENNIPAYADFLRRNDQFVNEGSRTRLANGFCDICVKLHNLDLFANHYTDINKWENEETCKNKRDF